ncbi:oxidoreductase family, NAD-binding Rossmann fold protein [Aspergillus indologenus CBS 114.80]|uniref:Oxidoreductase family, NAD-binding Rossmann fold protein n=1 Tax=Aspergillus indologenus CBS 114.80 TaxID=1450541 RepID=A0A2V5IBK8_9EURO|nr:oxidoreductase family, NAD-binding Rossmann fold protein [Aspergillus indologenus CBS 114.80]
MSIGVAIIGSGIFAREEHLPVARASPDFALKAIYSRSLQSAQNLASGVEGVDLYSEDAGAGRSYADLLAREDVQAVIIALPILAQPEYIKQALSAGKHVLSEKPIAKDLATAQELLQWYTANIDTSKTLWAVAENYRYLAKFIRTAEEVRRLGGVKNFRVSVRSLIKTDFKYYKTEWRRTPAHQGGFVLDGGIHLVAGLRLILGEQEALASVSAQSSLLQEYLAPVDTVDAVAQTKSGASGAITMSYGSAFNDFVFEFDCAQGAVTLNFDRVTVNGEGFEVPFEGRGVNHEVAGFAASIRDGAVQALLRPEQALADLEVMEGIFTSNGARVELRLQ